MRSTTPWQASFGAILVALALAGCSGGSLARPGPSGPYGSGGGSGTGYATFAWSIFDIEETTADPALALGCSQVGASTVVITLSDLNGNPVSQDAFPCAGASAGSTSYVPAGQYLASFDLYGDPAVYGNSTTLLDGFTATDESGQNAAVFEIYAGGENDFTLEYAPFIAQRFTVSWGIYSQGIETTCPAVGASYVYLDFLTLDPAAGGSTTAISRALRCGDSYGESFAIPYGPRQVSWSLSLANGAGQDIQVIDGGTVTVPTDRNINLLPQQRFLF
jgi:hypothetical protein